MHRLFFVCFVAAAALLCGGCGERLEYGRVQVDGRTIPLVTSGVSPESAFVQKRAADYVKFQQSQGKKVEWVEVYMYTNGEMYSTGDSLDSMPKRHRRSANYNK
jgi:hypothetical protein